MLTKEVYAICDKHYDGICTSCPLFSVCDVDPVTKTDWWGEEMNKAAARLSTVVPAT